MDATDNLGLLLAPTDLFICLLEAIFINYLSKKVVSLEWAEVHVHCFE